MSVQGLQKLKQALQKHDKKLAKGWRRGLLKGGLFLQRESQKIVPVEFGFLRASANTRAEGQGFDTEVYVGYTADYALYVHEDLNAKHKPGKQAKFLEQPLREHRGTIIQIVASEATK